MTGAPGRVWWPSCAGWLAAAAVLCACPPPPTPDAGPVDAGVEPTACALPESCREAGVDGVCRGGFCQADVPCGDDVECGLGERCQGGRCRFLGCVRDADCLTNKCLTASYSCVECGAGADCPRDKPVCSAGNVCVACSADAQCTVPGPGHCSPAGACVHCLADEHCPNGLTCGAGGVCQGAPLGAACPEGVSCAAGLICVLVGTSPQCLTSCDLYSPTACRTGEICYKLTYSGSTSLVFESAGPIGVCFQPQPGARGLREACTRSATGTNCQPNLMCVPETANVSLCRTYCDPITPATCAAGEVCQAFPGDYSGRKYGLCLPDAGFGVPCLRDGQCRAGTSCQAYDDPASLTDLSTICQFNVGASPGLAPCAPRALADGGVLSADRTCQSGSCRTDPFYAGAGDYFCYAACKTDADCSVGGRTGACDGTFAFTSPFGTAGTVPGCRPGCTSTEACGEYDAGVVCRLRLTSGLSGALRATCAPATGTFEPGAACSSNSQCRSGYCGLDDGRGVRRQGRCAEACSGAVHCATDAGTPFPLSCEPTVVLAWRGYDGQPNTSDDRLSVLSLCGGGPCTQDGDCTADGGAVCAVDPSPAQPTSALVQRCRTPTSAGLRRGGDACSSDAECRSGLCGALQAPSTGAGRACFEACTGATPCPGATTCRAGGLRAATATGPVNLDSCAP